MNNISYRPSFTSKVIIDDSCYTTGNEQINKFLRSGEFKSGIQILRDNGEKGTVRISHRRPNLITQKNCKNSLCMVFRSFTRKDMAVELVRSSRGMQIQYALMHKIFLNRKSLLKFPFRILHNVRSFFTV